MARLFTSYSQSLIVVRGTLAAIKFSDAIPTHLVSKCLPTAPADQQAVKSIQERLTVASWP
jgi:hypothetical protein